MWNIYTQLDIDHYNFQISKEKKIPQTFLPLSEAWSLKYPACGQNILYPQEGSSWFMHVMQITSHHREACLCVKSLEDESS